MTTIIKLELNEPDGIMPSDSAGNLDDLAPALGSAAPTSVDAWTGRGRSFVATSSQALVAADLPAGDTLLTRDATIQAIISMTLVSGTQVLLARGRNDGTASERYCYGLEIEEQVGFPGFVEARWFWQDSSGALKVQPAGVWQHPGDGKFFLLTATRRWVATDKVIVRYYVDDEMIAELETTDGDIGGGTTGHFTLGARQDTGAWEHFFNGTIDELLVTDHEMSPEEVRHTWRRLTEFQPGGLDTFVGLIPKGLPWAKDLGNLVGRHVKHAGSAIGFATASIEELRAMFLPDAAPLGHIDRWERICGLAPRPNDSLDERRARVVGFLSRSEGFAPPAIRVALAEVLDCDPDDLEVYENTNRITDGFATFDTAERWLAVGPAVYSVVAGELELELAAANDVRWHTKGLGSHARMSIDRGDAIDVHCYAKLASHSLANDTGVGILLHNRVTDETLWFGVYKPGAGAARIAYRTVIGRTLGAVQTILDPAPATVWLRVTPPSSVAGEWTLSYSSTGPGTGFVHTQVALGELAFDWVGVAIFGDASSTGAIVTATFDDFDVFCPQGLRPFGWHVYRDPALGGAPDVEGGHLVLQQLKPAHTIASVTQNRSLIVGSARDGVVGRGPLGRLGA